MQKISCELLGFRILLLAALSTLLRLHAFQQTPFANGWDAYFYLIQVRAWEETGHMHSPEASLIYPFFRLIHWFSGDYVAMFKIGAALLAGCWTAVVCLLAKWRQSPTLFFVGAWTVFSPHLTYFAAQYPKNLLGLCLLGLFMGCFQERESKAGFVFNFENLLGKFWLRKKTLSDFWRMAAPAGFLLLLNFFGHRLTFGLSAVFAAGFLLFFYGKKWVNGLFSPRFWAILAFCLLFFWAAGQIFPGVFHWADFERLGLGQWAFHFTPYLFVQDFMANGRMSLFWAFEIWAMVGLLAFSAWLFFKKRLPPSTQALFCLLLLLLCPFLSWSFTGLSFRFLMVFVLLAPLLLVFGETAGASLPAVGSFRLAWGCLVLAFWATKSYAPEKHDPDYLLFQKVSETSGYFFREKTTTPPELVIAHNSLAEFFTFTTRTDAMPWLPEYPIDSVRLWRIATDVTLPELEFFAGEATDERIFCLPGRYFLLNEYLWQEILANARRENDLDFLSRATSWRNPSKIRPGFLLQRK